MEAGRGDADGGLCRGATRQLSMMGLLHANCQCFSRPRHVWPDRPVPLPERVVFTTDHRTSIGLPGGIPKGHLRVAGFPEGSSPTGIEGGHPVWQSPPLQPMKPKPTRPRPVEPFSEKGFYLDEFHGRTLGVAAAARELREPAPLLAVLAELAANDTRAVLISDEPGLLRRLTGAAPAAVDDSRLPAAVWRAFSRAPWAGVVVPAGEGVAAARLGVAEPLGLSKVLWIDAGGGLRRPAGTRDSFVDREELRQIVCAGAAGEGGARIALLREIERALDAGVAVVNLSTLEGLADELFTYAGSGTHFSRQRYVEVRPLGLDDYDPADDLIARGVAEGYLAPRAPEEVEAVLVNGFGAFVEGVHLAGIGALLVHGEVGEIASLYTLTRYLGGGIGAHLIRFAVERAGKAGLRFVFACTTSERVVAFFEGQGFREVPASEIPVAKWDGYDPERRDRVRCLRREL